MASEERAIQAWAFYHAFADHRELEKFNCQANQPLVVEWIRSQNLSINPMNVWVALQDAERNGNRLPNGTELAVKQNEQLAREAVEKAERERKQQEEADKLAIIQAENEVFKLCKEISEWRGGSDKHAVQQELARISRWTLEQLREYKAGIDRQRAAKGLSASEYKAQLHTENPQAETFNGFPILPAKWNRTAIRTAPVATLRTLIQKYGKTQLDARLQAVEE